MTILTALQSVAIRVMGQRPAGFFTASSGLGLELSDLANEVATDIAKYQDWQALIRTATISGDGTAEAFPLPADYDRMLQNSLVLEDSAWFWGYGRYNDINAFMYASARGFPGWPGGWIMKENELCFTPAPTSGAQAVYPYITTNWALADNLAPKAAFTADTDTFALPERLLTLGLIWRWRENKKLDASGDQEAFIKALDEYAAKDAGARSYRRNGRRGFPGTHAAWPGTLGPLAYPVSP